MIPTLPMIDGELCWPPIRQPESVDDQRKYPVIVWESDDAKIPDNLTYSEFYERFSTLQPGTTVHAQCGDCGGKGEVPSDAPVAGARTPESWTEPCTSCAGTGVETEECPAKCMGGELMKPYHNNRVPNPKCTYCKGAGRIPKPYTIPPRDQWRLVEVGGEYKIHGRME